MVFILLVGAIGHVVLWVTMVNRIRALGIPRRWGDSLTVMCGIMLLVVPITVLAALANQITLRPTGSSSLPANVAWMYILLCAGLLLIAIVQRWYWHRHPEREGVLLANHTSHSRANEDVEPLTARGFPTWLSRLPGNQFLNICVQEKELAIPRLPRGQESLSVAHLSDLHISGRLTRAYFEQVVDEVNRARPDIVTITGDIVEHEKYLAWLPATLGRLQPSGRVYYILGNHDRNVNEARLKAALAEAGLTFVGGIWRQVIVGNMPIILAGNELPWYKPAADMRHCPPHDATGFPLRILLAHSPDQFKWAQANDMDLVLAGHLHGGQVRLPLLGAIASPSLHGVRYASGVFRAGDTVMHVSRGTGSLSPFRFNCPPEIAVLKLSSIEHQQTTANRLAGN